MYKFHGLVVKPNKVLSYAPPSAEEFLVFYLKKAVVMTTDAKPNTKKTRLYMKGKDEKEFYCVGALDSQKCPSCDLDYPLCEQTEFKIEGDDLVSVHLTGYIQKEIDFDNEDDSDQLMPGLPTMDDIEEEEEEEDSSEEEEDEDDDSSNEEENEIKENGKKEELPKIEEIDDSEEEDEEEEEDIVITATDVNLEKKELNKDKIVPETTEKEEVQPKASETIQATKASKRKNRKNKNKQVGGGGGLGEEEQEEKNSIDEEAVKSKKQKITDEAAKVETEQPVTVEEPRNPSLKSIQVSSNEDKTPAFVHSGSNGNKNKIKRYTNGFQIETIEEKVSDKKVIKGNDITISYEGKLENGNVFDSNAEFKFKVGKKEVIRGIDVGVEGMAVGEKRKLIVPPSMGFGKKGVDPDIPPNAKLYFDISLKIIH